MSDARTIVRIYVEEGNSTPGIQVMASGLEISDVLKIIGSCSMARKILETFIPTQPLKKGIVDESRNLLDG